MQTQFQQSSKKNKVTVPFYSPPCRLYGQTSADIIKEARAAVMTSSPLGIKPVFTSRPFTPNQKERTLFGSVKRNKSRPPSSFSLRHLNYPEPSACVKLPSIDVVSDKKTNPSFQHTKNLSLDNLTEDYDAEVYEQYSSSNDDTLPTWKKASSCPKEVRVSKVFSLNDISNTYTHVSYKQKETSYLNEKSRTEKLQEDYESKVNSLLGEPINLESNESTKSRFSENPVMTIGGGDFVVSNYEIKNYKNKTAEEKSLPIGDASVTLESEKNKKTILENDKINNSDENDNTQKLARQEEPTKVLDKAKELEILTKNSKSGADLNRVESVDEKSVITESKSEYLTSFKSGFKNIVATKEQNSIPLEILELYETARYYGIDVTKNSESTTPSAATNHTNNLSEKQKTTKPELDINASPVTKNSDAANPTINKPIGGISSNEDVEFVMNNKKRYHVASDKNPFKEKAYKKWNDKQEAESVTEQSNSTNDGWDLFWKNSYYRNQDEAEDNKKDDDRKNLQILLNKIVGLIKKGAENQEIYETTSQLYGIIKNNKIILDSKLKENISRALYLYVDNENAEVLLSLAKIFFMLKDENCLSVACKIIFKIARFDTNDHLFLNEEDVLELFLEGIGRASPLDCAECCIYGYGALKFLTLNHSILSRILHLGALDLMTLHLKLINNSYSENSNVGEQTQHALFQLTGALRNVAAGEGALPLFLTTNCISILCNTLKFFCKDEDVTVNISRTLSLLSTDEIVTQALMQVENILPTLIELMDRYKESDKILIRVAFSLGNIVEHSDLARVQLSRNDTALTVLLSVLKLYIDKDLETSMKQNDNKSDELSPETIDDVIVKVIRIIANMSMNPIVGSNFSPTTKEKRSVQLSKLLSVLLMRKDPGITLLATLGCLNNISYYCNSHSVLIDITQGVERVLGLDSIECQIEAARVLGNLTRHKEIRDLIYSTGGVDLLINLLSSSDQEVVRCVCGALVNMMLDLETRNYFVKAQGIDRLIQALETFPSDWSLASLVARAIWNSCGNDVSSAMKYNNMENLEHILAVSLEEENWNDGDVAWEEFASVATDLLEKISSHLETI